MEKLLSSVRGNEPHVRGARRRHAAALEIANHIRATKGAKP